MRIVFRVTGNKSDTLVFAGEQIGIAIFGFSKNIEVGVVTNQPGREVGIARMRRKEGVIKPASQQRMRVQNMVFINARDLFGTSLLRDAIQNIQRRLYRPTDK